MINNQLPLVELHRHLDGNIRPATILDLAFKNSLPLAATNLSEVEQLVQIRDKTSDLLAFLKKLDTGVQMLANLEDCKRIAFENIEDAYNENIDYIELRFSPFYMSQTHGLPISGVVEAVIDGVQAGMREFGVKANLIGILSRTFGAKTCFDELQGLLDHKDKICALDLAGDEIHYPAELFQEHFKKGRDANWHITVHAGEADGPKSIWNAINLLGAVRIGHGVAAIQEPQLMEYLAKHQIGIESCPTSNYQTATVKDIKSHPLKTFLDRGIPVTLSTDDPGVSAITLEHEYKVLKEEMGITEEGLHAIQRFGVEQAFLSKQEKLELFEKAKTGT